jgi:phage terminase large subunit GpA-like protein
MRVLSRTEIAETARLIASDGYCADICELALNELHRLDPPRKISTLDYSKEFRVFRKDDGTKVKWSLDKAPWAAEIMAALDNPNVREVVVPKPARCGGTVIAENYALKMMQFGPSGDIMWYLAGPGEVSSYAYRVFKNMFEDHSGVAEKVGHGTSDDKLTMKKIGQHTIELMAMSGKTTTNREGLFIVFDEPDSYNPKFASNFMEQGRQRQRMIGNKRKLYACAHPDIGWSGGISQAWLQSSRGIYIMQCPCCEEYASANPTKHWPDVPRFKLHYQKSPERTPIGERLKLAADTAAMLCPNSGCLLDDEQRKEMIAGGQFMHEGQRLDVKSGIIGDPDTGETVGFWVHVLMVPQIKLPELAREMEGAIEHHQRTGKSEKIKQVLVRTFGEAFEGAGDISGLDASALKKRTRGDSDPETKPVGYRMGQVPDGVVFVTAAVDPGGKKFDYMLIGWDLHRRRYVIDRKTIKTRRDGDLDIDIRPTKVQDDWNVLVSQVIDRKLPFKSDPSKFLPVAVTVIDSGDGNATPYAYEFARRMDGKHWGDRKWRKVRCIKGASSPNAPQLSPSPLIISKDDNGKPITPVITMHTVGSHSLKEDVLESLAIDDEGAGQWFFPIDFPDDAFEEFFNEPLIEGKWNRTGPQESLDLGGYNEAARQMLEPDRTEIRWDQSRMPQGQKWTPMDMPAWARPISLTEEGGDPAVAGELKKPAAVQQKSIFEQFNELNGG